MGKFLFANVVPKSFGAMGLSTPNTVHPSTMISTPSAAAFHSTIFDDFDLVVSGTYNFYTPDESNPATPDDAAKLIDLPRYVELSWRSAPNSTFPTRSQKRSRGLDLRGIRPIQAPVAFETAQSSLSNGYVAPGAISALIVPPINPPSPTISNSDDAALVDPATVGTTVIGKLAPISFARISPQIRVNFVDPSIAGAVDPTRVSVTTDHVHAAQLGAISKLVGSLEIISEFNQDSPTAPPPTFPTDSQTPSGRYIGYVIERHDLGTDGSMLLSKTFHIDDPAVTDLVDRDVKYLGSYVYRIRSIFQWSHPPHIGFDGPSTVDVPPGSGTATFAGLASSFYGGSWSDWSRIVVRDTSHQDPPDEISVIPRSANGFLRISWKIPRNAQREISSIRLLHRAVGAPWTIIGEFPPTNGAFNDHVPMETPYIYAAVSLTYHGVISALSVQIEGRLTSTPTKGEHPIRQVSESGQPYGTYGTAPVPKHRHELRANRSATFYCRAAESDSPLNLKDYVIEIRSLSTGERRRIELHADSTSIVESKPTPSGPVPSPNSPRKISVLSGIRPMTPLTRA